MWAAQWAAQPDAPVLIDGWDGARVVDAATLDARTAAAAAALAERGVGPGDRVLWCARATLSSIEALLGVLRAGAVLVPVSPSATGPEIDHVVGDARPVLAVCDRDRPDAFGAAARSSSGVDELARAAGRARPVAGTGPAARRRRADRLHVGDHGQAEGGGAHPRLAAGRRLGAADRLGVDSPRTASSSACRSSTCTASVPGCSAP